MKKKLFGVLSIPLLLAAAIGASAPSAAFAADPEDTYTPQEVTSHQEVTLSAEQAAAFNAEVDAYVANHPDDWTGLDNLRQKLWGAPPIEVSLEGVDGPVSAAQADAIIQEREAAWEAGAAQRQSGDISLMSVPSDAFTVAFVWLTEAPGPGSGINAFGTWNFRDDYVNGSNPHDVAAIRLTYDDQCVDMGTTTWNTLRYDQVETGAGYLYDGGVGTNAPIVNFEDSASGFMLNVDHGFVKHRLTAGCGPTNLQGMFTYEHNQDALGSISGISASWGGLSVSYTGAPATLQKSSQPASLWY